MVRNKNQGQGGLNESQRKLSGDKQNIKPGNRDFQEDDLKENGGKSGQGNNRKGGSSLGKGQ